MPPCFAEQNATAHAGAEVLPPCFAEQNATAHAGAEVLPPCFAKQNALNKLIIALNVLINYICFVNILIKNRYLMFQVDSIAQLKEKVL